MAQRAPSLPSPNRGRETTGLRALPKRRGELSGLSVVQWSAVTQMELSQVLMVRSAGELEVVVPAIDDDGWDAKVHLRGEFGSELTVQAKCTGHLLVRESRAPRSKDSLQAAAAPDPEPSTVLVLHCAFRPGAD